MVDVGVNVVLDEVTGDKVICGDVHEDVWNVASRVSPVPGETLRALRAPIWEDRPHSPHSPHSPRSSKAHEPTKLTALLCVAVPLCTWSGGIGVTTLAMLMRNTADAALLRFAWDELLQGISSGSDIVDAVDKVRYKSYASS